MPEGSELMEKIPDLIALYAPKLLLVILTLIIGSWIIKHILKLIDKGFAKKSVEISLRKFAISLIGAMLKILLFISVVSMVGIKMTSFIAILGAMTFAVGMALQGSLANFAGGVLIILFKPFRVGDFVEAQGYTGVVSDILLFNTILKTPDNKTVMIPNGGLASGSITNYSVEATRRVDLSFGIGYDDDLKKAQQLIFDVIAGEEKVLKEPDPFVRVGELGDSSVNFTVRVWVKTEDYWDVHFELIEKVKLSFDANGISIPFPQTDVHIYQK